jgi:hypothetical protein
MAELLTLRRPVSTILAAVKCIDLQLLVDMHSKN